MRKRRTAPELLRRFVLERVEQHPGDVVSLVASHFRITRQAASKHVTQMVTDGLLEASGKTKGRTYKPKVIVDSVFQLPVSKTLQEDMIWRDRIFPILKGVPESILNICHFGFTEMLNNVVDHSGASAVLVGVKRTAIDVSLSINDNGIGIFEKLQKELGLDDPRHALLELSKGKLTTDREHHTGEGIFFTSRMFGKFTILSGTLYYSRERRDEDDWLIESEERLKAPGTLINMTIRTNAQQTAKQVFDRFAAEELSYAFSKTHVPVKLAKYQQDQLISRSAAKRVLARFDKFREIMLDFQGIDSIGSAFADEIFRVFKNQHPDINLVVVNASPEVNKMIERARSHSHD